VAFFWFESYMLAAGLRSACRIWAIVGGCGGGRRHLLDQGRELAVLTEQPYATEDVLQLALAEHPEVIAGLTTSGSKPGNLLLVRREMGVPDAGGSAV
jgi:hypothetical protein